MNKYDEYRLYQHCRTVLLRHFRRVLFVTIPNMISLAKPSFLSSDLWLLSLRLFRCRKKTEQSSRKCCCSQVSLALQPAKSTTLVARAKKCGGSLPDGSFMPSALGEPRGAMYWCDNRCSAKAGEAHTINLCQQCYNEKLAQQGKQPLKSWQWRGVVEKKAHRGRT